MGSLPLGSPWPPRLARVLSEKAAFYSYVDNRTHELGCMGVLPVMVVLLEPTREGPHRSLQPLPWP
jgi:hypothetical protein